jgi:4-diphosphocytidyl-2-C-methyl-D-erythritol kinase
MASDTLTLNAPAKLNLALSVGSPDPDDGMHPIASWMVAIDFHDTVRLRRARTGGAASGDDRGETASGLTVAFAEDAPRPEPIDWPMEKDLAWRALEALEAEVGRRLPTRIEVAKRVPTGAGLGGGSSDAAAVLVGLDQLWGLGLGTERLAGVGARLGSDVPFLVHAMRGEPSMLATGLGERLSPGPRSAPITAVLVLPACKCPTGPVYRAFDEGLGGQRRAADAARVRRVMADAEAGRETGYFNDLAEPAMRVAPELADAAARLGVMAEAAGVGAVRVSGSGSTLFVATPGADAARSLAKAWSSQGWVTVPAVTLG